MKTELSAQDCEGLKQVRSFALRHGYEPGHSEQVARLAAELFDQMQKQHRLDGHDRFLLECGAVLHDLGWQSGKKGHHKESFRMILEDAVMPFAQEDRAVIALLARYHRKALPQAGHPVFAEFDPSGRQKIRILAGILRIADGLDRTHADAVCGVEVRIEEGRWIVLCRGRGPIEEEIFYAQKKADLLGAAVNRKILILADGPMEL